MDPGSTGSARVQKGRAFGWARELTSTSLRSSRTLTPVSQHHMSTWIHWKPSSPPFVSPLFSFLLSLCLPFSSLFFYFNNSLAPFSCVHTYTCVPSGAWESKKIRNDHANGSPDAVWTHEHRSSGLADGDFICVPPYPVLDDVQGWYSSLSQQEVCRISSSRSSNCQPPTGKPPLLCQCITYLIELTRVGLNNKRKDLRLFSDSFALRHDL